MSHVTTWKCDRCTKELSPREPRYALALGPKANDNETRPRNWDLCGECSLIIVEAADPIKPPTWEEV